VSIAAPGKLIREGNELRTLASGTYRSSHLVSTRAMMASLFQPCPQNFSFCLPLLVKLLSQQAEVNAPSCWVYRTRINTLLRYLLQSYTVETSKLHQWPRTLIDRDCKFLSGQKIFVRTRTTECRGLEVCVYLPLGKAPVWRLKFTIKGRPP
jgi:hypothetical protein